MDGEQSAQPRRPMRCSAPRDDLAALAGVTGSFVFIDHCCMGANSTLCGYLEPDGSSELAFFQCNNGVCETEAIES